MPVLYRGHTVPKGQVKSTAYIFQQQFILKCKHNALSAGTSKCFANNVNNQMVIKACSFIQTNLTFIWPCIVIYSYNKTNETHWFLKFILEYSSSILILLASSQQSLYDIHQCCVYSIRLLMMDRKLSKTWRVLFGKNIWEIGAFRWFCYKNYSNN